MTLLRFELWDLSDRKAMIAVNPLHIEAIRQTPHSPPACELIMVSGARHLVVGKLADLAQIVE